VNSVVPTPGFQIRSSISGGGVILLIRGNLGASGKLADLQVADRNANFAVTVQAAAANALGGYAPLNSAAFKPSISRP
jgi:hypothetical protein